MHKVWLSCLAYASLIPLIHSAPTSQQSRSADPIAFHPVGIKDYEAAVGLHRRDDKQFSDLDLQSQSQLVYGSAGGESCRSFVKRTNK